MDCGHGCITVKILKSMGLHASKGQITCSGNHISTKLSFKRVGRKVGPRESILMGDEMVKQTRGRGDSVGDSRILTGIHLQARTVCLALLIDRSDFYSSGVGSRTCLSNMPMLLAQGL